MLCLLVTLTYVDAKLVSGIINLSSQFTESYVSKFSFSHQRTGQISGILTYFSFPRPSSPRSSSGLLLAERFMHLPLNNSLLGGATYDYLHTLHYAFQPPFQGRFYTLGDRRYFDGQGHDLTFSLFADDVWDSFHSAFQQGYNSHPTYITIVWWPTNKPNISPRVCTDFLNLGPI